MAKWRTSDSKKPAKQAGIASTGNRSAPGLLSRLAVVFWLVGCGLLGTAKAAQLKQATIDAFQYYVTLTEDRMAGEIHGSSAFLWLDQLQGRSAALAQLRQGQVITQRLETLENGRPILIPSGMVHHWLALVFVPNVDLAEAIAQQQEYERSAAIYGPDIQDCRVLQANGNNYRVYYRLHKKVIVTVNYNADFEIRYVPVDGSREYTVSYSTRIAEVQHAGMPNENERPVGIDRGYLWRLNTYTRYEQRDGGVYIQTEFIALSRSVPAIFAWLVDPYIRSIPQEYLVHILGATRRDLMSPRIGTFLPQVARVDSETIRDGNAGVAQ